MHPRLIQLENAFKTSTLTKIDDPLLKDQQIELWVKRDDLIHPVISGNKWRKLKYTLDFVLSSGMDTVVSMGGAYSNHLHALAYAGNSLGLKTVGIIRGEKPKIMSPALLDMIDWGMTLKFVSRTDFRHFRRFKNWQYLPGLAPGQYWLPEGGSGELALKGVAELVHEIEMPFDFICAPCGTGTTLAGIIDAAPEKSQVLGFSALKNSDFLATDIKSLLPKPLTNWQINQNYHFGGFALSNTYLNEFIEIFESKTSIPLDPVYSGKMMYGLFDLIKNNFFQPGQRIIAVHTGGLQGKRALKI